MKRSKYILFMTALFLLAILLQFAGAYGSCVFDLDNDGDVDGKELSLFSRLANPTLKEHSNFALQFGETGCVSEPILDYITISSIPDSGVSPFETVIRVDATFDFSSSGISYSGPGIVEYLTSTKDEYTIRITTPGVYYFTVEVTDNQAIVYSDSMEIEVVDPVVLDTQLQNQWNGMKAAMISGDIQHAATYFIERARAKYTTLMQDVTDLSAFAGNMKNIEMIYFKSGIFKYRIHRIEDVHGMPTSITYYIYFTRDTDGKYKIYKF